MDKVALEEYIDYEQPSKYIVSDDNYNDDYDIPVLTAGQSFLLGYTNEKEGIFPKEKLPIILFDDFTTSVKFVKEPFKVKSSALKILLPKNNNNIKFFYYLIKNIKIDSTTHKRYWISEYAKMQIKKYSIEEQNKIEDVLSNIDNMIQNRTEQLNDLDNLIDSKFFKMFGSPFNNTKWKSKELKEIAESISDGNNVDVKYYQESGSVLFLRIQNVWRNEFKLDDSVYISQEANKKYADTSLKHGDILITKIGRYYTKDSSLGRTSIYLGEDDKANYSNNIMRVRVKADYNSEFINVLLNLKDYQQYIRNVSKGGTDKRALSKTVISSFPIITPPLQLQNEYINFVNRVEKQKKELLKDIEDLEKIMRERMHTYFD